MEQLRKKEQSHKVNYKDVIAFTKNYWQKRPRSFALLIGCMAAATIIDVFVPVYTGKIIDALTNTDETVSSGTDRAVFYLMIFAILALSFNILRWIAVSVWAWFAVRNLYEILTDAMQKVQRFSSDWHANSFAGATVRKITRGMWAFDLFGDTLFMGLFPAFMIMIGMTAMLIVVLPWVGIFAAVMIVIYCALSIWMSIAVLAPRFRMAARADTSVGANLADIMTGNPSVKAFGAESREEERFQKVARDWREKSQRAWLTGELGNLIRGTLRALMLIGMVGMTIWMWQAGRATAGDIALAITSFFIIGGYLRDVGMHIANLQKSVSEMEDVISFWKQEVGIQDAPDAKTFVAKEGRICFDRVRFFYKGQDKPIYEGLDVQIRAGEKVALVGHSGSGKSTFVKLLQRLYDIQGGQITVDGQNIADVTQQSLRSAIALVPQEPILFHRSLAENIAYGKPEAKMEEIIDVARKAYAHDFVKNLPLGYDTLVGERGIKLSGGERQRVAIARALLSDAPILILDEATSALDSVSEHYIQKALATLMQGRTTITIAHRLATIKEADRIIVFDKGRIAEQGTHEELVNMNHSLYHRLFQMQALDLIGNESGKSKALVNQA